MAMKRKPYCSEASRCLYEDYYRNQRTGGNAIPVFVGRRYQRSHGIGQMIGGLFKRCVVPLVSTHAKLIGKQVLGNVTKTGMEVVGDVMVSRSAKEAIKERGLSGIKRTVGDIMRQSPLNFGDDVPERQQQPRQQKNQKNKKKTFAKKKPTFFFFFFANVFFFFF